MLIGRDYEVRTRLAAREIEDGLDLRTEVRFAMTHHRELTVRRDPSGDVALTLGDYRADLSPSDAVRVPQLLLAAAGEPADG